MEEQTKSDLPSSSSETIQDAKDLTNKQEQPDSVDTSGPSLSDPNEWPDNESHHPPPELAMTDEELRRVACTVFFWLKKWINGREKVYARTVFFGVFFLLSAGLGMVLQIADLNIVTKELQKPLELRKSYNNGLAMNSILSYTYAFVLMLVIILDNRDYRSIRSQILAQEQSPNTTSSLDQSDHSSGSVHVTERTDENLQQEFSEMANSESGTSKKLD